MLPKHLTVKITSPEATVFDGVADALTVTTEVGTIQILPGHTNFIGTVSFSKVFVRTGNTTHEYFARHGIVAADQNANEARLMAFSCESVGETRIDTIREYQRFITDQLNHPEALNDFQIRYLQDQAASLSRMIEQSSK
jgi:F0F1-type ATP synthase epsilon subunit